MILADGQPDAFGRVMRHNWADGPIPETDNFRMIPAGEAIRAPCAVTNHLNVIGCDRSGARVAAAPLPGTGSPAGSSTLMFSGTASRRCSRRTTPRRSFTDAFGIRFTLLCDECASGSAWLPDRELLRKSSACP